MTDNYDVGKPVKRHEEKSWVDFTKLIQIPFRLGAGSRVRYKVDKETWRT